MAKTIFITGASSGLGKAAALLFADKGWHVIATMRSPENETDLGQIPNIHRLPLDVTRLSPGGIATDFASRSLVLTSHEAYTGYVNKVFAAFSDPERQANASTAGQIADVVYEAATDGKDQLRYVAGNDAKALYAQRLQVGDEAFRQGIDHRFFD